MGVRFIVSSYHADLMDFPGERKIGSKRLGDKGFIEGGPVEISLQHLQSQIPL